MNNWSMNNWKTNKSGGIQSQAFSLQAFYAIRAELGSRKTREKPRPAGHMPLGNWTSSQGLASRDQRCCLDSAVSYLIALWPFQRRCRYRDPSHRCPGTCDLGSWACRSWDWGSRKRRILGCLSDAVHSRNSGEVRRNLRSRLRFRQIFISLQPSRHAELLFHWHNSDDSAPAANPRVLRQRDLGGHNQRQFHCITFRDLKIGVEKYSTTTQVLGKAVAFAVGAR